LKVITVRALVLNTFIHVIRSQKIAFRNLKVRRRFAPVLPRVLPASSSKELSMNLKQSLALGASIALLCGAAAA
jgi:hypothetical protein